MILFVMKTTGECRLYPSYNRVFSYLVLQRGWIGLTFGPLGTPTPQGGLHGVGLIESGSKSGTLAVRILAYACCSEFRCKVTSLEPPRNDDATISNRDDTILVIEIHVFHYLVCLVV